MTEVIDAMAALQICIPCTCIAAHYKLRWMHKPKLTHGEIHGFYIYSQLLTRAIAQMKSDTLVEKASLKQDLLTDLPHVLPFANTAGISGGQHRGNPIRIISHEQCHSCYEAVGFSTPYMQIEIAVNMPTRSCIEQRNIFYAARYCNKCSKKLFSVNDNGFTSYC